MKESINTLNALSAQYSNTAESEKWLYWKTISRETIANCKIFSVNKVLSCSDSDAANTRRFSTLTCGDWVNIIAITPQSDVILVEQYRHGIEDLTLEIPGGSVDIKDPNILAAAKRELKEETGFTTESWSLLGKNNPNPALQNNLCYTFLAEKVRQVEKPNFDDSGTEKINILSCPLAQVSTLIRSGIISHALVITAFHFLALERPDCLAIF